MMRNSDHVDVYGRSLPVRLTGKNTPRQNACRVEEGNHRVRSEMSQASDNISLCNLVSKTMKSTF